MLHFYTYIYPFVFFFSFQKRLANLFLLLHLETDFFFGRISKRLKGADCKSVRIFLSGVRIPLLPPGWACTVGVSLRGGLVVLGCFAFFVFSVLFGGFLFVFSDQRLFKDLSIKKHPRQAGVFFEWGCSELLCNRVSYFIAQFLQTSFYPFQSLRKRFKIIASIHHFRGWDVMLRLPICEKRLMIF